MDFTDNQECIVFKDSELLPAPRQRGRLSIKLRVIIWCVCLAIAATVIFAVGGGLTGALDEPDVGGGGEGGYQPVPSPEESSGVHSTFETEMSDVESNDTDESYETEASGDLDSVGEDFVTVDLSFSEKGDGYFYNYSKYDPDVESLLDMGFDGGKSYYSEKPVVLILHTYIREGYFDLDPNSPADALGKSVISVGERIAYDLNSSGVPAIHCTVIHGEGGNGAYYDAAETIRYMLKIYPSIEYVIDLRRMDEIDEEGRILKTQSSLNTAQIRLTVSSKGSREQDNLALALSLRRELNLGGKALCMPIVYTDAALNAGLTPYYVRVDVGSSGNVINEALEAAKIFADAFADILKK